MDLSRKIIEAQTAQEALEAVVQYFLADSGTVHVLGGDGQLQLRAATKGLPESVMEAIRTIPVGKGMAGLAVQRRMPVDSCNIQTDSTGDVRPGALATGLGGAIVVPIFRDDGVIGALGIANRAERKFSEEEISELMAAGRTLARRSEFQNS